ncbi:MAG: hypothetical protein F6K56_32585 [Moorea sp. SIO3G5]|nr:hypothetical protein [Moorena sp. SIO3G5]
MTEDFVPNENNNPEETTPDNTPQEPSPKKYPVKHILKGSRKAILNTMYALYALRYAETLGRCREAAPGVSAPAEAGAGRPQQVWK